MTRYFVPWVVALGLIASVSEASAQRVPHYSRTPVVSPYINLFRENTGGSNSYFSFVRPLQTQLRMNQEQEVQNQRLMQQIQVNEQMLRNPYMEVGRPILGDGAQLIGQRATSFGRPAVAASYFNYSHFYGMPTMGRGGRRSR